MSLVAAWLRPVLGPAPVGPREVASGGEPDRIQAAVESGIPSNRTPKAGLFLARAAPAFRTGPVSEPLLVGRGEVQGRVSLDLTGWRWVG